MHAPIFGLPFVGMPGWPELLIVAAIVLLLFGKRLPGAMRSLGQSIVEFKKGVKGVEDDPEQASETTSGTKTQNDA